MINTLPYEILAFIIHEKKSYKNNKFKLSAQLLREMINLNYLMDHILYHIFKIILSISLKKMKQ